MSLQRMLKAATLVVLIAVVGCQNKPSRKPATVNHETLRVPPMQTRLNEVEQQNADLKSQLNQAWVDLSASRNQLKAARAETDKATLAANEALKTKRDSQQAAMEIQKAKAELIEAQAETKKMIAAANALEQKTRESETAANQLRMQVESLRKDLEAVRAASAKAATKPTTQMSATPATQPVK